MKQYAKTKAVKSLPEAGDRLTRCWVTVSTGSMVMNCANGSVSSGTLMIVLVYDLRKYSGYVRSAWGSTPTADLSRHLMMKNR